MIFVTTLGIIVILTGLVLVFTQGMRTEATGSANRLSAIQADAIEQGAEQWVLAQVEQNLSDAVITTQVPGEAIHIGNGYFWLLYPDPELDQNYSFGIVDESSKLNLNVATSDAAQQAKTLSLLNLPSMTQDVADSIVAWRTPVSSSVAATGNGAQSDYYQSLQPQGYVAKNAPFETVEELLLVRDIIKDPPNGNQVSLFGYDLNRNGVIDQYESSAGGTASQVNSGSSDRRGFYPFVTAWSVEPNTAADGTARTNVNDSNTAALQKVLSVPLPQKRVTQIMARLAPLYAKAQATANAGQKTSGKGGTTPAATSQPAPTTVTTIFANIGAFYVAAGLTSAEFAQVADQLTASTAKTLTGMVNVNTAPVQVLSCLPGLDTSDAQALVDARRNGADTTSIGWIFDTLTPATKAVAISGLITSRSFQYSADIIGVSGDGRAFKRVRIVVDTRKVPAKIVYRRDLTGYGWPLDPQIQSDMRTGKYKPSIQGMGLGSTTVR
jgi:type II secretory pathway component PulK